MDLGEADAGLHAVDVFAGVEGAFGDEVEVVVVDLEVVVGVIGDGLAVGFEVEREDAGVEALDVAYDAGGDVLRTGGGGGGASAGLRGLGR